MAYLVIGAVLFVAFYGAVGRRAPRRHADWRTASAIFAVGLFAAAGFVALRGGWSEAALLAVIGMGLTASARWPRRGMKAPSTGAMSLSEARATLGVDADASTVEIKAAYARLIQRVHPDRGGAPGLAAHLNQARDVLLKS